MRSLWLPEAETTIEDAVKQVIDNLEEEDFQFSMTAGRRVFNVYRFKLNGQVGQIALRIDNAEPERKVGVGYFEAGERTAVEIERFILENIN